MKKIDNDLTISTIVSKQNSPISILSQEKFSSFLKDETKNEEDSTSVVSQEVDIFMQSLQNKAQLNRMIIDSVA